MKGTTNARGKNVAKTTVKGSRQPAKNSNVQIQPSISSRPTRVRGRRSSKARVPRKPGDHSNNARTYRRRSPALAGAAGSGTQQEYVETIFGLEPISKAHGRSLRKRRMRAFMERFAVQGVVLGLVLSGYVLGKVF